MNLRQTLNRGETRPLFIYSSMCSKIKPLVSSNILIFNLPQLYMLESQQIRKTLAVSGETTISLTTMECKVTSTCKTNFR